MAIQTTSNLSDSIREQYDEAYYGAARVGRLYDQLAMPVPGLSMQEAVRGSKVNVPFLSSMAPGTDTISQTADVTPTILDDTTSDITPTSRYGALQWSELVDIQAYTNVGAERFRKMGENMVETIDLLAQAAAVKGSWVERYTTRANLDAGTPAHRASDSDFSLMQGMMASLKVAPFVNADGSYQTWAVITHPWVFHDIRESGNVDAIGIYQDMGIHLNYEVGKVGNFRIVESPYAKVFGGAGVNNGTNDVDTTLNGATDRLDKTMLTSDNESANIAAGKLWTVGTEETGSTHYADNERVKILSASTTTLTFAGEGENGGFRYAHATGTAVRNADSVYTMVFGGPESLVKLFVPQVGEFGMTMGPEVSGTLDQFPYISWKWYGAYDLLVEKNIIRKEVSVSYEA
jgi:hypothetical protein